MALLTDAFSEFLTRATPPRPAGNAPARPDVWLRRRRTDEAVEEARA